ncbi:337_t:CDS:2, partial [Diversispora eburnea]
SQFRKYMLKKEPFDMNYDLQRDTPMIWWQTYPSRIEKMARIHSYYISNVKKHLTYFGQDLSDEEIEHYLFNYINSVDSDDEERIFEEILLENESDDELDSELLQNTQNTGELISEEELNTVLKLNVEVYVEISDESFTNNRSLYCDESNITNNTENTMESFISNEEYNVNELVDNLLDSNSD